MKPQRRIKMPLRRPPQRPRPPAASKMRAKAATVEDDYDEEEDYEGDEEPNMKFSHALLVVLILHVIAVGGVFAFNSIKSQQTNEKSVAQTSEVAAPAAAATTTTAPATPVTKPAVTEKTAAATTAPAVEKEAATKPVATGSQKTHTVVAGDTLSKIATQYSTSVESLEKANGLTTYSMIRVGQVLNIPGKAGSPAPVAAVKEKADITPVKATTTTSGAITSVAKPAPAAVASQPAKPVTQAAAPAPVAEKATTGAAGAGGEMVDEVYVVAKGDNPYSIAKRFGISYTELLKANDIQDPTKIQIGQKLKVPSKTN